MNLNLVKSYIENYKENFEFVHSQEIYKWKAIKQFQDNFDINAKDFGGNLEISLNKTKNLLGSGRYFPRRMLKSNAQKNPEKVRDMFNLLYDEDLDILERIKDFKADFKEINVNNFQDLNDYQDDRAIVVYLTLRYPERYFFYKFTMFKEFAQMVEYPYKPIGGRIENVSQFFTMCELLRYEIEKDQELLKLHEKRINENCYYDLGHNVLTQDLIYASVRHLNINKKQPKQKRIIQRTRQVSSNTIISDKTEINFKPSRTNFIQNNIENKRTGDLGELWVLKNEIDFLKQNNKEKLAKKVNHVSVNKGDGLGYDILSFNLDGTEKYIEVKTTKGKLNTTFYITRNELEKSKFQKDNYFLYRVYEFDEENQTAKILKINGELTSICQTPVNFKVSGLKEIE